MQSKTIQIVGSLPGSLVQCSSFKVEDVFEVEVESTECLFMFAKCSEDNRGTSGSSQISAGTNAPVTRPLDPPMARVYESVLNPIWILSRYETQV